MRSKIILETVPCNLCEGTKTEPLYDITEKISGRNGIFKLVRCTNCGLCFINPRPTVAAITHYYPEESYYAYRFNDPKTMKQRIRNYILEERGGYPHEEKERLLVRIAGQLIGAMLKSQILMHVPNIPDGKALDIGCGCGEHLLWLRNHGWKEVHGVEISRSAAMLANEHNLNVFCGELTDAHYPDSYFDFISINHVLEHMHDPMAIIKEIQRILKKQGLLIIGVPNFGSYENKILGKHQIYLEEVPRHLYHFSRDTITALLERNGFAICKTVGKTFFLGSTNRRSLRKLRTEESPHRFLSAIFRIYIQRPFMYVLANDKESFGPLFTFYVRKAN